MIKREKPKKLVRNYGMLNKGEEEESNRRPTRKNNKRRLSIQQLSKKKNPSRRQSKQRPRKKSLLLLLPCYYCQEPRIIHDPGRTISTRSYYGRHNNNHTGHEWIEFHKEYECQSSQVKDNICFYIVYKTDGDFRCLCACVYV